MKRIFTPDVRERVFPIFLIDVEERRPKTETAQFLGTGFFISSKGDAITAAHVIPRHDAMRESRVAVALLIIDGREVWSQISHAIGLIEPDIAIIKVNAEDTKFYHLNAHEVYLGQDVTVIGIPKHQVWNSGLEIRVLKGCVTGAYGQLELNFSVPAGMSGSPVLVSNQVVGYATGRVRSEQVEEEIEELVKVSDNREEIHIRTASSIVHYGIAHSLFAHKDRYDEILRGKSLLEFINDRIGEAYPSIERDFQGLSPSPAPHVKR